MNAEVEFTKEKFEAIVDELSQFLDETDAIHEAVEVCDILGIDTSDFV